MKTIECYRHMVAVCVAHSGKKKWVINYKGGVKKIFIEMRMLKLSWKMRSLYHAKSTGN